MNPNAIFVCSHIQYDGQLDLLDTCLHSLTNQTEKADIYVSISIEGKYKKEFAEKILKKYSLEGVQFCLHNGQLYQMEHLKYLTKMYSKKGYRLIMFCDDDDTYVHNRVEIISISYKYLLTQKSAENCIGFRESFQYDGKKQDIPEYWGYAIRPDILNLFFELFEQNPIMYALPLLKHKFADMYLRYYLHRRQKGVCFYVSPSDNEKLYNYNTDNPNSICARLPMDNNLDDQLLLKVIGAVSDYNFQEILKENIDYYINGNKIEPIITKIYLFCKYLYSN